MNRNSYGISLLATGVATILWVDIAQADHRDWRNRASPFDVADLYAELNNTDGDLGFHALIDGDAWKRLEIEDPRRRKLLNVAVRGRLRKQGLTEIFFESAEPNFEDLSPEAFFERFPEGMYEVEGRTLEGKRLASKDLFHHVMPAPAVARVNGVPMARQCDEEEPGFDISQIPGPVVTIDWDPVVDAHPTIGSSGDIEVAYYQVVAEVEVELNGIEFPSIFSATLPADITSITLPAEFISQGETFKYEVLVKEATGGNQTAEESCFRLTN
jgi:hypothetical protein